MCCFELKRLIYNNNNNNNTTSLRYFGSNYHKDHVETEKRKHCSLLYCEQCIKNKFPPTVVSKSKNPKELRNSVLR